MDNTSTARHVATTVGASLMSGLTVAVMMSGFHDDGSHVEEASDSGRVVAPPTQETSISAGSTIETQKADETVSLCTLGPVLTEQSKTSNAVALIAAHCVDGEVGSYVYRPGEANPVGIIQRTSSESDVALVRFFRDIGTLVEKSKLTSDEVEPGDDVSIVGSTTGVSIGKVTSTRRAEFDMTTCVNLGDSGGPVFNDKGEAVGVISYLTTLNVKTGSKCGDTFSKSAAVKVTSALEDLGYRSEDIQRTLSLSVEKGIK